MPIFHIENRLFSFLLCLVREKQDFKKVLSLGHLVDGLHVSSRFYFCL